MLPNSIFAALAPCCPALWISAGRHRFGEGKLGILHHHAPQQRDEQNAQHAAHQHQRRRLPVRFAGSRTIATRPT